MMLRRVVVLLLGPTLLFQGMCFTHSHAREHEPARHNERRHVHIPTGKTHTRDHGKGHHHHHGPVGHHHQRHEDVAPESTLPTAPEPGQPQDHDDDAVFIGAVDAVAAERWQPDDFVSFVNWIEAGPTQVANRTNDSTPERAINYHPPPLFHSLYALYVQDLALVI